MAARTPLISGALSVNVAEVLDPALWRKRYAYGLAVGRTPETTARRPGRPARQGRARSFFDGLDDETIRWHLRAALSEAEVKLGVSLAVEVIKSHPVDPGLRQGVDFDRLVGRLPFTSDEQLEFFRIDLPLGPVLSVERIRAFWWDTPVWEFSDRGSGGDFRGVNPGEGEIQLEWHKSGSIHILPTDFQALIVTQGGSFGVWHTLWNTASKIPDVWSVDYTIGPADRDNAGKIPTVLAHWVYAAAGILLLSIGGLAQSKGLSSTSLSIDGVSKSVGLQASAIYGINSALENAYNEAMKRIDWKQLQRQMGRGMRVRMY